MSSSDTEDYIFHSLMEICERDCSQKKYNTESTEEIYRETRQCANIVISKLQETKHNDVLEKYKTENTEYTYTNRYGKVVKFQGYLPSENYLTDSFSETLIRKFTENEREFNRLKSIASSRLKIESKWTFSKRYTWTLNYIRIRVMEFMWFLIQDGHMTTTSRDVCKSQLIAVMTNMIAMCKLVNLSSNNLYLSNIGWRYRKYTLGSPVRQYELKVCDTMTRNCSTLNFFHSCRAVAPCPPYFESQTMSRDKQHIYTEQMRKACDLQFEIVCATNITEQMRLLRQKQVEIFRLLQQHQDTIQYRVNSSRIEFVDGKYFNDIWPKLNKNNKQIGEKCNYLARVLYNIRKIDSLKDNTTDKYSRVQIWMIEYLCVCLMKLLYYHILIHPNPQDQSIEYIQVTLKLSFEWWQVANSIREFEHFETPKRKHAQNKYDAATFEFQPRGYKANPPTTSNTRPTVPPAASPKPKPPKSNTVQPRHSKLLPVPLLPAHAEETEESEEADADADREAPDASATDTEDTQGSYRKGKHWFPSSEPDDNPPSRKPYRKAKRVIPNWVEEEPEKVEETDSSDAPDADVPDVEDAQEYLPTSPRFGPPNDRKNERHRNLIPDANPPTRKPVKAKRILP